MCSTMKESLRAAVVNGAWIERTVLVPCVLGQMKSLRHNEIFANNFASLFFAGLICVLCMLKIIPNAYTKTDKVHTLPVSCKLTVANISPSTQAHLNIKSFNIIYELHKNSQSLIFNEKVAERVRDRERDRERVRCIQTIIAKNKTEKKTRLIACVMKNVDIIEATHIEQRELKARPRHRSNDRQTHTERSALYVHKTRHIFCKMIMLIYDFNQITRIIYYRIKLPFINFSTK